MIVINQDKVSKKSKDKSIQEVTQFLENTDWIEIYRLRHATGLELIPSDSSKWKVINKRNEYKEFIRMNS